MTNDRLQQLEEIEKAVTELYAALNSLTEALHSLLGSVSKEEARYMADTYDQRHQIAAAGQTYNA
jgi:Mg2+ and Co2+ transporter CorA